MKRGGKKRVIGFNKQLSTIRVRVTTSKVVGETNRSFTIRLRGTVTEEQVEDLRDFLLEAAKDWYEELVGE